MIHPNGRYQLLPGGSFSPLNSSYTITSSSDYALVKGQNDDTSDRDGIDCCLMDNLAPVPILFSHHHDVRRMVPKAGTFR